MCRAAAYTCGFSVFALFASIGTALAVTCSDITPGATEGPHVPAGRYNPAFDLPYDDACYVRWPANNRGHAGREADRKKCNELEGAEVLEYAPDGGSNVNMCVFRITGSSEPDESSTDSADQAPAYNYAEECEDKISELDKAIAGNCVTRVSESGPVCEFWLDQLKFWCGPERGDRPTVIANAERKLREYKARSQRGPAKTTQSTFDRSEPYYTLQVCNYANDGELHFARAIRESGDLVISGWWSVQVGECKNAFSKNFGTWSAAEVYLYGETKNYEWYGKKNDRSQGFCISNDKYARVSTPKYSCDNSKKEKLRYFWRYVVNKGDGLQTVYKVTFK